MNEARADRELFLLCEEMVRFEFVMEDGKFVGVTFEKVDAVYDDDGNRSLVRDFGEVEQLQVSRKGPSDFVSAADLRAEKTLSFGSKCGSKTASCLSRGNQTVIELMPRLFQA